MAKQYSRETLEAVKDLRVIDDDLFRLMANRKDVCEEILRTLLNMPKLNVLRVTPQDTITSLQREITLDVLCTSDSDKVFNIEMQKGQKDDDVRRCRFHASAITARETPKGAKFADIPTVFVLYISDYDALENHQAITLIRRCQKIGDDFIPVEDGEQIIFANTAVKEDSKESDLLQLFLKREVFTDPRFPAISEAINYYKGTEGGRSEVCEAVEKLITERSVRIALGLIKAGVSRDVVLESGITLQEYEKAKDLYDKQNVTVV